MLWLDHSKLKGLHSILSPSQNSWLRYPEESIYEKLNNRLYSSIRTEMGTALHEFAADSIELRQRLSKSKKSLIQMIRVYLKAKGYSKTLINYVSQLPEYVFITLMDYVNEGIQLRMDPEVILYYSENCFGTADTIVFDHNKLIIHDLKTGETDVHIEQLMIYAALFCLEYKIKPGSIDIELRLFHKANIVECIPSADDILPIMDKIIRSDKILSELKGV